MRDVELIIDLHRNLPRQGVGSETATRQAASLAGLADASDRAPLRIADLGCGTGAAALALAAAFDAEIVAVDAAAPFIEGLGRRATDAGVADRITAVVGDMAAPPIEPETLDAVWSEGAIYNIGFDAGIRAWWSLLKPGGRLVVSELVWTTADRPEAVHEAWTAEYPGITTVSENLRMIEAAGYRTRGFFVLPETCWTDAYYTPLREAFPTFLARHQGDELARRIVEEQEAEIQRFERDGRWYGYAFFIAEKSVRA